MSASAKITFADLPPSSSVTRLIVPAAPCAMPRPTSVEPVNAIFATSGCSTSRLPTTLPGPGDDVQDTLRQAGVERDPLQLERGQRRQLGRLQHDRVAGRERGCDLPRGDHEREVPRDDQAHHAERLAERHVDAPGDRDRLAQQPLGRARVVAIGRRPPSPSRRARRRSACRRCVPRASRGRPSAPPGRRRAGAAARRGRRATPPATPGMPPWRGRPRRRALRAGARYLGHHLLGRGLYRPGSTGRSTSRARTCGGARSRSRPRRTGAARSARS